MKLIITIAMLSIVLFGCKKTEIVKPAKCSKDSVLLIYPKDRPGMIR